MRPVLAAVRVLDEFWRSWNGPGVTSYGRSHLRQFERPFDEVVRDRRLVTSETILDLRRWPPPSAIASAPGNLRVRQAYAQRAALQPAQSPGFVQFGR